MKVKKTGLAALTVGVVSLGVVGATQIKAQEVQPFRGPDTLIQKIAQRFNLNQDDVKKVFDEERSSMEANHQKRIEDKLNQAVTEGKITAEQKAALLTKLQQMKASHDLAQNLTPEQRKAQMQSAQQDLKSWADQNGINLQDLMIFGFKGKMHLKN